MKKTVFLFLLLCFFTTTTNLEAGNERIIEFENYEFRLDYFAGENNSRGYHVEKLGENPFEIDVIYDERATHIRDIVEVNNHHVFYGFTFDLERHLPYDGFLLVLDENGTVVHHIERDFGELDEIWGVYEMDNLVMVHYRNIFENDRDRFEFLENQFVIYDLNYNELNTYVTYTDYKKLELSDNMLLYRNPYSDIWDGAITSDLQEIKSEDSLDIPTGTVYNDYVSIPFVNIATLNNQQVMNGVVIDYPGNYKLTYNNFTYDFIVKTTVSGIEDGGVYNEPVTPNVPSGNVFLNDDLFISGTEVTEAGNYVLKVQGSGGYVDEYDFTITSNIKGILHNQNYQEPVEITFNGKGYLNNSYIESPYTVSEPGEYILKIQGENNYLETFYFNIEEVEEETSLISFIQKYDVVFLGVVVISGGLILKKK